MNFNKVPSIPVDRNTALSTLMLSFASSTDSCKWMSREGKNLYIQGKGSLQPPSVIISVTMNLQREYNCVWAKFAHARDLFSPDEACNALL